MTTRLTIVPSSLDEANAFVATHHRHHKPVVGHKFSIAVADGAGTVRGVAIVGRPVSRHRDDGWTLEVTRVATDGCPNACSALYGATWRATKAMGYRRLGTYVLADEPGTSLLEDGTDVDVTWMQFDDDGPPLWMCCPTQRTRDELLSSANTVKRYRLLRERVGVAA